MSGQVWRNNKTGGLYVEVGRVVIETSLKEGEMRLFEDTGRPYLVTDDIQKGEWVVCYYLKADPARRYVRPAWMWNDKFTLEATP